MSKAIKIGFDHVDGRLDTIETMLGEIKEMVDLGEDAPRVKC